MTTKEQADSADFDSWMQVLILKMRELEAHATWASIVSLGRVRDHIRMAKAELQKEIDRLNKQKSSALKKEHPCTP